MGLRGRVYLPLPAAVSDRVQRRYSQRCAGDHNGNDTDRCSRTGRMLDPADRRAGGSEIHDHPGSVRAAAGADCNRVRAAVA